MTSFISYQMGTTKSKHPQNPPSSFSMVSKIAATAQKHVPKIHIRTCVNQWRTNWPLNLLAATVESILLCFVYKKRSSGNFPLWCLAKCLLCLHRHRDTDYISVIPLKILHPKGTFSFLPLEISLMRTASSLGACKIWTTQLGRESTNNHEAQFSVRWDLHRDRVVGRMFKARCFSNKIQQSSTKQNRWQNWGVCPLQAVDFKGMSQGWRWQGRCEDIRIAIFGHKSAPGKLSKRGS